MKRALSTTIALALCLLGCGTAIDGQVPLITSAWDEGGGCWLLHETVDVFASSEFGTVVRTVDGPPVQWPKGYTARRAGTEVEILDRDGKIVLTTGSRYELAPTPVSKYSRPISEWVIGCVTPCPDCELGGGVD